MGEGHLEGDDARGVGGNLVLGVEEDYARLGEIGSVAWKWKIVEGFCVVGKEILQHFFVARRCVATKETLHALFQQLVRLADKQQNHLADEEPCSS